MKRKAGLAWTLLYKIDKASDNLAKDFQEDAMKKILNNTLFGLFIFSTSAIAAESSGAGEGSLLLSLFVGFFALIIVFQLVPAVLMLVGMLRGLFGRDQKKVETHR